MEHTLTLGRHRPRVPLIQGGMGVRISAGNLAGHVARCGGVGLVASAGIGMNSRHFDGRNLRRADRQALQDEIQTARRLAPKGVVGVNCMVALSNYAEGVQAACEAGAMVVVSGAGLPLNLPEITADFPEVALVPIVSSLKAAQLIARRWHSRYGRLPDAVVVEDPDTAGGHLGARPEDIGSGTYDQYATVRAVKDLFLRTWATAVPVVAAGGIWDRGDLERALAEGADGVQMATRFVCTEECDADPAFKEAYLRCRKEDIGIIMSPAGLPGRALGANLDAIRGRDLRERAACPLGCLKSCTYQSEHERFCIVHALDRAQRGDTETGLVFCGSNAWRAERIETVAEVFADLFGAQAAQSAEGLDLGAARQAVG